MRMEIVFERFAVINVQVMAMSLFDCILHIVFEVSSVIAPDMYVKRAWNEVLQKSGIERKTHFFTLKRTAIQLFNGVLFTLRDVPLCPMNHWAH